MAYNPSNPNGQSTSANSAPVVLASDQTAIPITDNGGSVTIDGNVGVTGTVTISGTVTANVGTGTQPVSGTIEIGATSLTALENITIQNGAGVSAVNIQDGGNSITIDGSVSVSNFPATQPVSGTIEIGATSLSALETISVANFPATQPVSGTITANAGTGTMNVSVQNASIPVTDNGGSLTIDGTVTANAGTGTFATSDANAVSQSTATASQKGYLSLAGATATLPTYTAGNTNAMTMTTTGLLRVDGSNVTQPISGTITANAGTGTMNVSVQNASIPVTGTFFQATQPVSGTITADTELPTATTLGDTTANPTAPHVGSCIEGYNGTSWDRIRTIDALTGTGANAGTLGVIAVGTGPGFAHRYNPANLGTAINSTSAIEVEGGNTMSFGIGTTTTGTFIFEGTTDATNWLSVEVFDAGLDMWVSGQNITPTLGKVYHLSVGGYRQIRLRTTATLGATVVHTCNVSASQQLLAGIDTGAAPHNFGYLIVHKDGEYTTTQTGTAIWTPATGKKFAVTDISITTGGTTAGIVTLWQGAVADTTYTTGTDPAIFRGEFAPTNTSKPGAIKSFNVPYISTTIDHILRVTTSAAMTLYIQINGYEI